MASTRKQLLHVGFMLPIHELVFENDILNQELGQLDLRCNAYAAVLFYKDANQDTLHGWFDQRKQSSRTGYLRAYYSNKRGDSVVEMDVDGKQFYLITSAATARSPIEMKRDISRGQFGERKQFSDRIQVPCFPYKFEVDNGFIYCDALTEFQKEQQQKRDAIQSH